MVEKPNSSAAAPLAHSTSLEIGLSTATASPLAKRSRTAGMNGEIDERIVVSLHGLEFQFGPVCCPFIGGLRVY
jgi:hypothetical protein